MSTTEKAAPSPFTEEHEMFRRTVREFVKNELAPHVEAWEAGEVLPREVIARLGEMGWLGLRYPEAYGGAGLDYWFTVCFAEELRWSRCGGLNMAILVQTDMATPIIEAVGTEEQKQEFLAPAIRGEKIAALGISEPGAGSDVSGISTVARRDGDDLVITGAKTFITNGTVADFITLLVKTDPEAGYGGMSFVLFPTATKGFSVGRKLKKIGNWASDTAELRFDGCRIPRRYLLGEEGQGFYYCMRNFQGERLVAAIISCSGARLVWEETVEYARERKTFGKPIIKHQALRHELTQLLIELEAAQRLTYHACDLFDRGVECTKEITMAKIFAGETAIEVIDRCLQAYGGYGYMEEFPVARAWRDMRLVTIGGGTSEVLREYLSKMLGM